MGVPASEVGYTSATARRGDHESSYEHVVALGGKKKFSFLERQTSSFMKSPSYLYETRHSDVIKF